MQRNDSPVARLLADIVEREPLSDPVSQGYSGAVLERIRLGNGESFILKQITPESDLVMRVTHDRGRAALLWTEGFFGRFPHDVEHATVAAEAVNGGWLLLMRDVSAALLPEERLLTRDESRHILRVANAVHETFWGEDIDFLCALPSYLGMMSPGVVVGEQSSGHPLIEAILRGWVVFFEVVPADVVDIIRAIHRNPTLLAEQLSRRGKTLIHGDLWLANLGFLGDKVVMLDWGLATLGHPALEFASYLCGNWSRIQATREEIIEDFRAVCGKRYDEVALRLAFLAIFAQYGWNKVLGAMEYPDEAIRRRESEDLAWWIERTREAMKIWSPVQG